MPAEDARRVPSRRARLVLLVADDDGHGHGVVGRDAEFAFEREVVQGVAGVADRACAEAQGVGGEDAGPGRCAQLGGENRLCCDS